MQAAATPGWSAARPARRSRAPLLLAVLALHLGFAAVAWQAMAERPRSLATAADARAAGVFYVLPAGAVAGPARQRTRDLAREATLTDPLPPAPLTDAQAALRDARYLRGASLALGPEPVGAPDFSAALRHATLTQPVVLRVYVSAFGYPDRVEVRGDPLDADFAQALQRALELTSFLPARRDGHDVAAYVDYEFHGPLLEVRLAAARSAS
jgi:hypothetical protein